MVKIDNHIYLTILEYTKNVVKTIKEGDITLFDINFNGLVDTVIENIKNDEYAHWLIRDFFIHFVWIANEIENYAEQKEPEFTEIANEYLVILGAKIIRLMEERVISDERKQKLLKEIDTEMRPLFRREGNVLRMDSDFYRNSFLKRFDKAKERANYTLNEEIDKFREWKDEDLDQFKRENKALVKALSKELKNGT